MIPLRPYQADAIERVRAQVRAGARRILIVSPTGSGKTVIASHIVIRAVENGRRVLVLAHRREIIQQTWAKLLGCGLTEQHVGIIMATDARRRPGAPVQVASVDTLRARAKPLADLVIRDEAHRALARTDQIIARQYPDAIHLGMTATPYRGDGRGLEDAYDALVVVATPSALIADGFLVAPRVFTVPQAALPDLSGVRVKRGDYDAKALASAVDKQTLVGNIVEHWTRHAQGVPTVVFAASVEHSKHIVERFRAAGVLAEHLDAETPTAERDAILGRLESGETHVVSNVMCLAEGWDQPSVKCCVLARPTKSTGLYLQQAGRILRPFVDPMTGASRGAVILDHAGCAVLHGLPQDDREFSLSGAKKRTVSRSAAKVCPECRAVVAPATRTCSECGFQFAVAAEVPDETATNLVEIPPATMAQKRAVWESLCAAAAKYKLKRGWVWARYREAFGVAPPPSFARPSAPPRSFTAEEKAAYLERLRALAAQRRYKPGFVEKRYAAKFGERPSAVVSETSTSPEVPESAVAAELEEWAL